MYKDCNVVMLPTNEKESSSILLGVLPNVATLTKNVLDDTHDWMKFGKPQHLYIISNEKIKKVFKGYAIAVLKEDNRIKELIEVITVQKDGCNRYTSIEYQQFSFKYHSIYPIIATTDTSLKLPQPSKQFLQYYIKEYNKDIITKVEVEYEDYWIKADYSLDVAYRPVINPDNTINIKPIKDSWSREEVESLIREWASFTVTGRGQWWKPNDLDNWIKENL